MYMVRQAENGFIVEERFENTEKEEEILNEYVFSKIEEVMNFVARQFGEENIVQV